jgi:hypothetical protein
VAKATPCATHVAAVVVPVVAVLMVLMLALVVDCRMPGFPGNTCRTDYIRKLLEQGVKTRVPGEDFNVAAVRSHRSAFDSKFSDVDEAPVSHVDE